MLHSLLEELVGDIFEEYDEAADERSVHREDGSLMIDRQTPVQEALAALEITAPVGEHGQYDTIAGSGLTRFGRLPRAGEEVVWGSWCFEIVDLCGLRVDRIWRVGPDEYHTGVAAPRR